MLIDNSLINRCKPRRFQTFTGNPETGHPERKKARVKCAREINDDTLMLSSIAAAHKDVQKSGKMRLFKAIPQITTVLLGTTIGLAQPGKLAAKVGAGLGFLALTKLLCTGADIAEEKAQQKIEKDGRISPRDVLKFTAKAAGVIGLSVAAYMGVKNTKAFKGVASFAQKELSQLSGEINSTKLGKFFENKVAPFGQKHAKGLNFLSAVMPFGIICGSALSELELADSLSCDIKTKSVDNFRKAKLLQAIIKDAVKPEKAQEIKE